MCTFYVFQLLNLFLQDFSDLKDQGLALPTPTILGWERPELAALGIERVIQQQLDSRANYRWKRRVDFASYYWDRCLD